MTVTVPWAHRRKISLSGVTEVLEEYRGAQPEFTEIQAPIDKPGAYFFLIQDPREPVTEPDRMVPFCQLIPGVLAHNMRNAGLTMIPI